jgi:hypothetical protein
VLAHFLVDCITIPCLCLALFVGTLIGTWWIDPIQIREPDPTMKLPFRIPTNDDPEVRRQLERYNRGGSCVAAPLSGLCSASAD